MKQLITAVILTATAVTAQAASSMSMQLYDASSKLRYCLNAESCQIALAEYIQFRETFRDYVNQGCPDNVSPKGCFTERVEFSEPGEGSHKFTVLDAEKKITKLKQQKQAEDKQEREWKAESDRLAKLPGVKIGMTADQVLYKSNWSKPKSINRTTTQYGVREQWVYGDSYLYFDNGKLTAIQN